MDGSSPSNLVPIVGPSDELLALILKLNVDCFKDLFEWLSLADLKALRKTCKRMKQVVDDYIKLNYPKALRKIVINDVRLERLRGLESGGFELINHVEFKVDRLNFSRIEGIKHLLARAENIEVDCEFPRCDFHEVFLKHCTRVKHLMIKGRSIPALFGRDSDWLNRNYPTLEHIGVANFYRAGTFYLKCTEMKIFFEQNPNVRMFSTTTDFIWTNQDWILGSNIKFDRLDIWFCYGSDAGIDEVFDLLNELYERGFYQRLHVYLDEDFEREEFHQITSLHAIELLAFLGPETIWSVEPPSTGPKELILDDDPDAEHLDVLANSFPNIRRLCVTEASIDIILPFIQRCPMLTQIKIQTLWMGVYMKESIIDLLALNNERKKLPNARKITIFIQEHVFLENKWKQNINLSLIELKREHLWKQSNPLFETHLE